MNGMNPLFTGGQPVTDSHWLDWLYGPRRVPDGGGSFAIRGVRIDHDIVRDIVLHLRQHDANAGLFLVDPADEGLWTQNPFDPDRLPDAADWELERIVLSGRVNMSFNPKQMQSISGPTALRDHVVMMLEREGRPRIHWPRVIAEMPLAGAILTVPTLLWFLLDQRPPWSVAILLALLVVVTSVSAWSIRKRWIREVDGRGPGHRIMPISRAENRVRRTDNRSNLKVAVLVAVPAAIIGALLQWWFRH